MSNTRAPWAYPEEEPANSSATQQPHVHPAYFTGLTAPTISNPQLKNGMAIAALILGIFGIILFPIFIPETLAIIFGSIMLTKRSAGQPGRGLATAGLILGIIGLLFFIILIATSGSNT